MARIRSIKPGFFSNEHLAELSPWHRLCFAGLWTIADREGRLEDRPRRIKAALFPYDDVDVDNILTGLADRNFVIRYVADGVPYLAIPTFLEHQRPKSDETLSSIPAPLLTNPRGIVTAPRPYKGQGTEGTGQRTEEVPADGADRRRAEDFAALWNAHTTPPIPRCRDLTSKRRRHIKARMTERARDEWIAIFKRIEASAFCRGEKGWNASFDWVIGSPDVAVKVLEGQYDNRVKATTPSLADSHVWECPHEPKCSARNACDVKERIAAGKALAL